MWKVYQIFKILWKKTVLIFIILMKIKLKPKINTCDIEWSFCTNTLCDVDKRLVCVMVKKKNHFLSECRDEISKCVLPLCWALHFPPFRYCQNMEAVHHSRGSTPRITERPRCGEVDEPYTVSWALRPEGGDKKKTEKNILDLKAAFQSVALAAQKKSINYMPVKVHISWNGTLCCLYLASPGELMTVSAVSSLESKW